MKNEHDYYKSRNCITETNKVKLRNFALKSLIQLLLNGCLEYYWFKDKILPNHYFVYGEFSDMQAFLNYKKSYVVDTIINQLIALTASKPKYKHFEAISF